MRPPSLAAQMASADDLLLWPKVARVAKVPHGAALLITVTRLRCVVLVEG